LFRFSKNKLFTFVSFHKRKKLNKKHILEAKTGAVFVYFFHRTFFSFPYLNYIFKNSYARKKHPYKLDKKNNQKVEGKVQHNKKKQWNAFYFSNPISFLKT
jgi:hypothetical protein